VRARLTVGVVLPAGAAVASVRLDGHRAAFRQTSTPRGVELTAAAGLGGRHTLEVRLRQL
jgi:hypothetical protein